MQTKIVVVGSANTDFVIQVPELPGRGETVLGGHFITARGGKGANQAVAAARLGADVTLVARLGSDSLGEEARQAYRQEGIDTGFIVQDAVEPSGVALILVDQKGENLIAVAPGANQRLSLEDVRQAEPAIRSANCLVLQLEIPMETVRAAIDLAEQLHIPVLLNPAPAAPVPPDLLKKVSVLTPNEFELKTLQSDQSPLSIEQVAADFYRASGVKSLVVTLGAKGALAMWEDGQQFLPSFPVKAVDTTACGDAFSAALAVRLGEGAPLLEAVRFASAAAALAATRAGAQPSLPGREEVEQFLNSGLTAVASPIAIKNRRT